MKPNANEIEIGVHPWAPPGEERPTQLHLVITTPFRKHQRQRIIVPFQKPEDLAQLVQALIEHGASVWPNGPGVEVGPKLEVAPPSALKKLAGIFRPRPT